MGGGVGFPCTYPLTATLSRKGTGHGYRIEMPPPLTTDDWPLISAQPDRVARP
jgi:hypothetical protein